MASPRSRLVGAAAASALLILLSACTSGSPTSSPGASVSATPSASATPSPSVSVPVFDNLDAIKVTGEFGKSGTVTVPAPWGVDQTRTKVIVQGNGPEVQADGVIKFHYVGVDGRTGQVFDESFSKGSALESYLNGLVQGFQKGATGQKVGTRLLIGIPGPDGYDPSGGNASAGIEVGDSLVFLVDIVDASLARPSGTTVAPAVGLPSVTEVDGKPSVTIPAGATPPATTQVQAVIVGGGRAVKAEDVVVTRYVGWSWKTGKVIDDHYGTLDAAPLADAITGIKNGLVGQTVGSRVLLVITPADSWPEGNHNPPVDKGDTVVYVIDLLYATTTT